MYTPTPAAPMKTSTAAAAMKPIAAEEIAEAGAGTVGAEARVGAGVGAYSKATDETAATDVAAVLDCTAVANAEEFSIDNTDAASAFEDAGAGVGLGFAAVIELETTVKDTAQL
jgi:hypothetical protein